MRLSERAIEFPRLVLIAAVSVCVVGVAGILTIPKERTPRIKLPVIAVAVPNPGATPTTNEKEVVRHIEEEIESALDHLEDEGAVWTSAVNGAVITQIFFDEGIEVDQAKRDVESLINRVKGQFPADAQQDPGPTVTDIAFEDFPIIQALVSGGSGSEHRRRVADELESQIERINGVAGVDTFGGLDREVQIEINPHLMTLYGFSYEQVETAIRRANMEAPTGSIDSAEGLEQRVRSQTKLGSIEAIQQVTLGTRMGKPVILSDVAEVYLGYEQAKSLARYKGMDAVVLLVRGKTDTDVLATANTVQALVNGYVSEGGDGGIQVGTVRSQAREIGYMLDQLLSSAAYGIVLVVLILCVAMGWRNAGLIGIAVPFSIVGTAAIMWFARQAITSDLAINNMTMFGMILVVGMVVDGCIIVGENIYRHREMGRSAVDSAKWGISEVGGSLISAYLTTFAAFGPMLMIHGVMGDFLGQLPIVVMFALCSAMLVDHFLLPVLSVYLMRSPGRHRGTMAIQGPEEIAVKPGQMEIEDAEALGADKGVRLVYGRMLRWALGHRLLVLVLTVVVTSAPVALFALGAIGLDFFPDGDIPIIEVKFELPLGSSMENRTVAVASQIEQTVMRVLRPQEWYRSSAGGEPVGPVTTIGDPGALKTRLEMGQGTGPEFGMVYVELALAKDRERSAAQIRQAIVEALPPMPGVIVRVKSPTDGPPVGAPVLVRVLSRPESTMSIEALAEHAKEVERLLAATSGVYDVTMDYRLRPEIMVEPNRTVASLFDIDAAQIANSVNYALEGVKVGEVDFGGSEAIDLRMRNHIDDRDQLEDLVNLPLRSSTGKVVSLNQVARVDRVYSANVIRHYDRQRVIGVRAELNEGVLTDDVRRALSSALGQNGGGYAGHHSDHNRKHSENILYSDDQMLIEFGGETKFRDDAMKDLHIALIIAAAAMMIILTVKFNNFIQPLIVLFSVPLSLVGVSIGLMLCGFHFSVAAMIGVVALAGIVVNDAIVLVDFINQLRNAGVPMDQAVVRAGQLRLRPIFLTTVTTIGGLLPLALNLAGGGEFFQPLTVTIMFGLGFATLLQLFIVPLACYTFSFQSSLFDPVQNQRPETPGGVGVPPMRPLSTDISS